MPLSVLLVIVIVAALYLNMLVRRKAFAGLSYSRAFTSRVVEVGERFEIVINIKNAKWLPVSYLRISEIYPEALALPDSLITEPALRRNFYYYDYLLLLLPYQRLTRRVVASGKRRGRYVVSSLCLHGGDLLGLNTTALPLERFEELVVLPAPLAIEDHLAPCGGYFGEFSVRRLVVADPVLHIGMREYSGREPQKHIHWPTSLRCGRLMVKEFDFTAERTALVFLNADCSGEQSDEARCELMISFTRSMIDQFEEQGVDYAFQTNFHIAGAPDALAGSGWGEQHHREILEILGRLNGYNSVSFALCAEQIVAAARSWVSVIVVTQALDIEITDGIKMLGQQAQKVAVFSTTSGTAGELPANSEQYLIY